LLHLILNTTSNNNSSISITDLIRNDSTTKLMTPIDLQSPHRALTLVALPPPLALISHNHPTTLVSNIEGFLALQISLSPPIHVDPLMVDLHTILIRG
jgi:hypothetical protein